MMPQKLTTIRNAPGMNYGGSREQKNYDTEIIYRILYMLAVINKQNVGKTIAYKSV